MRLIGLVESNQRVGKEGSHEAELAILVLAVALEVLADGDRLFDEVPEVLRDGWCQAYPQTKGMR